MYRQILQRDQWGNLPEQFFFAQWKGYQGKWRSLSDMFNFELMIGGNISSALVFHYSGKGHLQPWHFADLSTNEMLDWLRSNPRSSNKLYEIAFLEWRQAYDELLQVVFSSWAPKEVQVLEELNLLVKENLMRMREDIVEQDRKRVEAEEAKTCKKKCGHWRKSKWIGYRR